MLVRSQNIIAGLPIVAPVASWNFARDRSLTPVGQPATITFTRAAAADRVNQLGATESVGSNLPRFTFDATTKESLGLLMESGDLAKITNISEIYNQTESTHVVEFTLNSIAADSRPLTISDGTANNRVGIFVAATTGATTLSVISGNVTQASLSLGNLTTATRYRVAFKLKVNEFAVCINGGIVVKDTLGDMPISVNKINLGTNYADVTPIAGVIAIYDIYSSALSDTELQRLSSQSGVVGRRANKIIVNGF